MASESASTRAVRPALLLALAGLAAVTLSANLVHLARSQGCRPSLIGCPIGNGPWAQPDSVGYVRFARAIERDGLAATTFERRTPGYPLILAASIALTGAATPALWLAVALGAVAAAAVSWLAGRLAGRAAAIAAGLLFSVWLSVHALAPVLLTDALHGFLVVTGLATALAWRETGRAGWAAATALAWIAAQSLRPTFFPVAFLLGVLLLRRKSSRRELHMCAVLCAATLLVPGAIVASNWANFGLASPSIKLAYAAACESVPELKSRLGVGTHREEREACRDRQRDMTPRERVEDQTEVAVRFFRAYPIETARMLIGSIFEQLLYPMRPHHRGGFEHLYPSWAVVGRAGMAAFWLAALGGTALLWRRDLRLALFLAGSFALVMAPAALIHTSGGRYRFPLELLFLPVVVMFVRDAARAIAVRARTAATPQP